LNRKCLRFDNRMSQEEAEALGFCEKCPVYLCMLLEGGGPSERERKRLEREERMHDDMLV